MTLTIQDLGALGELLGSVAVLATLIYLALQTRQNTMAIAAQLDSARIASVGSIHLSPVNSVHLQEALTEDRVDARGQQQRRADPENLRGQRSRPSCQTLTPWPAP